MITCTRRIQFCAGHRVFGHESKCAHLHGHNYVALFHARAPDLDRIGRVIDFSVLKEKLGGWIDEHWDHGFIVNSCDPLRYSLENFQIDQPQAAAEGRPHTCAQKLYVLDGNPTAEFMAAYLLNIIAPQVLEDTGVQVVKVELWETENCYATASLWKS